MAPHDYHTGKHVGPTNAPVLDLVRFVGPPEERNPTLVRAGGIGHNNGISTQVSGVNPAGPKVNVHCLHCPQSGLQSSIATIADVPQCNHNGPLPSVCDGGCEAVSAMGFPPWYIYKMEKNPQLGLYPMPGHYPGRWSNSTPCPVGQRMGTTCWLPLPGGYGVN